MLNESNLHNYQRHAVEHILAHPEAGLFLDLGLGKTVSTLTALSKMLRDTYEIGKVLVIAPKRVAESTWADEIGKWEHTKELSYRLVLGTEKQRNTALAQNADLYIINRENVAWLVAKYQSAFPFDCVVIDELSSFKSANSQRFKALRMVRPKVKRVIGLTGTPSPNGLIDLWAQMYLLDRGERLGKTITGYRTKYFTPGRGNGQVVFDYKLRGGGDEAIRTAIGDICISMSKADYLELPPRIDRTVKVKLSDSERAAYEAFARDLVMQLDDTEITAVNAAALSNKLQQYANGAIYDEEKNVLGVHDAKTDRLVELIEAATSPVLIAYAYRHDLEKITRCAASYAPREIKSAQDVRDWNAGKIKVLVGHPASMGHGLNLQKGGHTIIWFGLTWSLELYQQLNARLDRQGQAHPVIVHHLVTEGTIDERILASLEGKKSAQDGLLDAVKAIVKNYRDEKK